MITISNTYTGQPASTGTTVYTCSPNTTARVLKATATNDTTSVTTLTVNKIPSGGAEGDDNLILNAKTLGSKESIVLDTVEGQTLNEGDSIKMTAGADNQVTVTIDVVEMT